MDNKRPQFSKFVNYCVKTVEERQNIDSLTGKLTKNIKFDNVALLIRVKALQE